MRVSTAVVCAAFAALLACAVPAAAGASQPVAAPAVGRTPEGDPTITVMSRNLYLGADVAVAMDQLPDLRTLAAFLWNQAASTDFASRVPKLAAEASREKPDVIGLQEAARWTCRSGLLGETVDVVDFTQEFIEATAAAGVRYTVAASGDSAAVNPGFSFPGIPFLSVVRDPEVFQPLFGTDQASCGFSMSDVLLVREELAGAVMQAGTSEYDAIRSAVPLIADIERGYAWADVRIEQTPVRFVTTYLEPASTADEVPPSALEARQLVSDLAAGGLPTVVMGGLNSDPRDPRPPGSPNPSRMPEATDRCPAQVDGPTAETARAQCSAYWVMRRAGYTDAGPDPFNPVNLTWGSSAELAGPATDRVDEALEMGNLYGFTDRLDFVLMKGGPQLVESALVGQVWPDGPDTWPCDSSSQIRRTTEMSARLAEAGNGAPRTGVGICFPSDHAGVVATMALPTGTRVGYATAPPPHARPLVTPLRFAAVAGSVVLVLLAVWLSLAVRARWRRRRRPTPEPR